MRELGQLSLVIPISLYRKPSVLRDLLSHYKPGRETFRPQYGQVLATIIADFMDEAGRSLWNLLGGWTDLTVVPSTHVRGPHPLAGVASLAGLDAAEGVLRSTGIVGEHLRYDRQLFAVEADLTSRSFLLVEDAYVTGSRSQQAAAALRSAGARVAGILAIGRRVNPDHSYTAREFWDRNQAVPYDAAMSRRWTEKEGCL